MPAAEQLLDVVSLIYDAAISGDWLPALTLLDRVAGCDHAVLIRAGADGQHIVLGTRNPLIEATYIDEYMRLNEAWRPLAQQPLQRPVLDRSILDMDRYERSAFYNEFARPNGLVAASGGVVARRPDVTIGLVMSRSARDTAYEAADLATLTAVLPHLGRALLVEEMGAAITTTEAAIWSVVDTYGLVGLMVDDRNAILHANEAGQTLISGAKGLFKQWTGSIMAGLPDELHGLVRRLRDGDLVGAEHGRALVLLGGKEYALSLLPLPTALPWTGTTRRCYLLLLADTRQRLPGRAGVLRQLFGLTRAEANVVIRLGDVERLADIAADLGISVSTVKSLLSRAMDKLDLRTQSQIVRLTERLPTTAQPASGTIKRS